MLERILILALVTALALAAVAIWRWHLRRRTLALQNIPAPECLSDFDLLGRPGILYFTTPTCSQCRLQQTPTLQKLADEWGDAVGICKVDAVQYDELARYFGILTVPSTVVLDAKQRVIAINHGLASAERLREQVLSLNTPGRGTPLRLAPQQG